MGPSNKISSSRQPFETETDIGYHRANGHSLNRCRDTLVINNPMVQLFRDEKPRDRLYYNIGTYLTNTALFSVSPRKLKVNHSKVFNQSRVVQRFQISEGKTYH